MDKLIEGKVLIVTGSTSGIGQAVAIAGSRSGAQVVVSGRRSDAAAETVSQIEAAGGTAVAVVGDVTDPTFAARLVDEAVDRFGRLDCLVNAAGTIVRATAEDTSFEQWRAQMAINVDAVFLTSRAAVAAMRSTGGGAIVNISSTCGLVGAAGLAGYCASKGAVISLTQAMALDHAGEGIRINAICPGAVDTPMLDSGREGAPIDRAEVLSSNIASIPQGRVPDAYEIADSVLFLISEKAGHITGTSLSIDGGYTAQ